ncbi:hypothetical protein NMG60_11001099 [Bertholletia excelsa]
MKGVGCAAVDSPKLPWQFFLAKLKTQNRFHSPPRVELRKLIIVKAGVEPASNGEIRVCVNRTCRRQGSMEVLQVLSGIAPPHMSVKSCACLSRCGAGPNLVVLPQGTFVSHCATAARAANIMMDVCGGDADSWSNSLTALALRKKSQDEKEKSNGSGAETLLSQAIDLNPRGGIHLLYMERSALRLGMGNLEGALGDAKQALGLTSSAHPDAYICQGDVLVAMEQFDAADKSYGMALDLDPSLRRSKSFKGRIEKLRQKLITADLP